MTFAVSPAQKNKLASLGSSLYNSTYDSVHHPSTNASTSKVSLRQPIRKPSPLRRPLLQASHHHPPPGRQGVTNKYFTFATTRQQKACISIESFKFLFMTSFNKQSTHTRFIHRTGKPSHFESYREGKGTESSKITPAAFGCSFLLRWMVLPTASVVVSFRLGLICL